MVGLFYCRVSKIAYAAGTADLVIEDREGQIIPGVPFLATAYDMPRVGDMVAVVMDETGGRIERGVILGKIFSEINRPELSGPGIFHKTFSDGGHITYDPVTKTLDIGVDRITAGRISAKEITTE